MIFNMVGGGGSGSSTPAFTYSGTYNIEVIPNGIKVALTTSGTLKFSSVGNGYWYAFLVGGGGGGAHSTNSGNGGGGGGYTLTSLFTPVKNTNCTD